MNRHYRIWILNRAPPKEHTHLDRLNHHAVVLRCLSPPATSGDQDLVELCSKNKKGVLK